VAKQLTMKQAQAKCRRWRALGDKESLKKAEALEAKYRDRPDYEDDWGWLLRMQSGIR
jgi:hypothetical protein